MMINNKNLDICYIKMNNLCNELSFYKIAILDIKILLEQIKEFTLIYKNIRNIYEFESNEFYNLVSQEYIKNYDLIMKFENLFENDDVNSIISLCNLNNTLNDNLNNEMIENFNNMTIDKFDSDSSNMRNRSDYNNERNQCSNHNNLLSLFNIVNEIIKKTGILKKEFTNNNSVNDPMIANYTKIMEKGTLFLEIIDQKIRLVQKQCKYHKLSKRDKKIIMIAIIIIIVTLVFIIVLQIVQKNKKVNLIISQL